MKRKQLPTQARLAELFDYRESDGRLIRRVTISSRCKAGSVAGTLRPDGYRQVEVDGCSFIEHLIVWVLLRGPVPSGVIVDHCDLQRARNVISNLRLASVAENCANRPVQTNNKLGLKGVSFQKEVGRYRAQITHKNRYIYLGLFECPHAAHRAYAEAANRYHGDFARPA